MKDYILFPMSSFWLFSNDTLNIAVHSNLVMILMLLIVGTSIYVFSQYYVQDLYWWYIVLMLSFGASMVLVLVGESPLVLLMGWEGLGLSSYLLVVFFKNTMSLKSGMVALLSNKVSDVGMFICFGAWLMGEEFYSLFGFLIMAMIKSAQFPFHLWLKHAMAAPTPTSALVHSSTLVVAGLVVVIKFYQGGTFIFHVGLISMWLAGMVSLVEKDIKKLVALSTMSQVSMMLMVLGISNIVTLHLVSHAFFKSLLFLTVGTMMHNMYTAQDSRIYSAHSSKLDMSIGAISAIALCALMFTSGFYSKDLLAEYMISHSLSSIYLLLIYSSLIFTLFYTIRMVKMFIRQGNLSSRFAPISVKSSISKLILGAMSIFWGGWYMSNMMAMDLLIMEKLIILMLVPLSVIACLPSSIKLDRAPMNWKVKNIGANEKLTSLLLSNN